MNDTRKIITDSLQRDETTLTLKQSRDLLQSIGIPLNKSFFASDIAGIKNMSGSIDYPLVMKIVSPQISHKTDVGGVKINIATEAALLKSYEDMIDSVQKKVPHASIEGVVIEEMVSGTELIIGVTTDHIFGHLIMFGMGGILVETYRDVCFRLIPLTRVDAKKMIEEIKGKKILDGLRNLPRVNKEQLVEIILSISDLVEENPEIKEMDINPLVATAQGLVAIDARIMLAGK